MFSGLLILVPCISFFEGLPNKLWASEPHGSKENSVINLDFVRLVVEGNPLFKKCDG